MESTNKNIKYHHRVMISKSRLTGELHHRGLTIAQLADQLDVAPDTVKNWNRIGWPVTFYHRMIDFLEMDVKEASIRLSL